MSTFLLDRNAIKSLIEMLDLINVVDEASRMCGEDRGKISAKRWTYSLNMVISGQCPLPCRGVKV